MFGEKKNALHEKAKGRKLARDQLTSKMLGSKKNSGRNCILYFCLCSLYLRVFAKNGFGESIKNCHSWICIGIVLDC